MNAKDNVFKLSRWEQPTQVAVPGSKMQISNIFGDPTNGIENEGSIWADSTFAEVAFSKTFTATTVGSQGGSPLTTGFFFAKNENATGDVVAILGTTLVKSNNGVGFAGNLIARNEAGTTGTKLVGLEIDVEPAAGTTDSTASKGIIFNVFNIASNAAVSLIGGVGGGTWADGFLSSQIRGTHYGVASSNTTTSQSFINTLSGTFSENAIRLGSGASQGISFGNAGYGVAPFIFALGDGTQVLTSGNTDLLTLRSKADTNRFIFNTATGVFNLSAGGAIQVNGIQVLTSRITGWGAALNGAKFAAFDASTATPSQTAQAVAELINNSRSHGFIGS
jgi:hypothetical protein